VLNQLQLFLMKRGGEEIYVGPLGRNSCHLIKYFEVRPSKFLSSMKFYRVDPDPDTVIKYLFLFS